MNNLWNTVMNVKMSKPEYAEELKNFINSTKMKNERGSHYSDEDYLKIGRSCISIEARQDLTSLYEQGYGLKCLARSIGISYSVIRRLFKYVGIEKRTGRNVVTDKVKKFRSDRVQGNANPWYDWPNKNPEHSKKTGRGLCGFYTKKNGEKVFLRSSWEYIYAKWLDKNNILWKIEDRNFKLKNGETYRPDFFIFDEKGELKLIVEVKGFYKNRLYKATMLKEEGYEVSIITDIKPFCELSVKKECKEWNLIRQQK